MHMEVFKSFEMYLLRVHGTLGINSCPSAAFKVGVVGEERFLGGFLETPAHCQALFCTVLLEKGEGCGLGELDLNYCECWQHDRSCGERSAAGFKGLNAQEKDKYVKD